MTDRGVKPTVSDRPQAFSALRNGASGTSGDKAARAWLCNDLALRSRMVKSSVKVSTAMTILSFLGIAVMLSNAQLRDAGQYERCSAADKVAKMVVSALTVALLGLLVYYHFLQFRLHYLSQKAASMLVIIVAERERLLIMAVELVICSFHPYPSCLTHAAAATAERTHPTPGDQAGAGNWSESDDDGGGAGGGGGGYESSYKLKMARMHGTDVEDLLCAAMFLRVYQLARCLFLRSKLFATILNYSLRALAHSRYNYALIFRSYLYVYEGYALLAITLGGLGTLVCGLYLCESSERGGDSGGINIADSAWIVLITFLTVGYGDRVPSTYCGRAAAVAAGLFGSLCMGLAVSLLLRYMQPSYDELLTLSYLTDADLAKKDEHLAACVIAAAWRAHGGAAARGGGSALVAFGRKCKLLRVLRKRKDLLQLRNFNSEKTKPISQLFNLRVQHREMFHQLRELQQRQSAAGDAVETLKGDMAKIFRSLEQLSVLVDSD